MEVRRADRIADALEEMVFTGHFQNGQRLDEASLAKTFGVSRTPVREAFQRLVAAGLARQVPRRGVFVDQPGSIELSELFETMAEVEGVCGRLAAERMNSAALERLKSVNEQCVAAISVNDSAAYSRLNEKFHAIIFSAAGNAVLELEALRLFKRLKPFRRVQFQMKGRMEESVAEHTQIIDELSKGRARYAADVLRVHVGTQGDRFYPQMAQLKHVSRRAAVGLS